MIGTAHVSDGYPMYYDAVNEKGLGMAGLNFAVSAHYAEPQDGKQNIAQFEFIPWVLSQYATIEQARSAIEKNKSCRHNVRQPLSCGENALDNRG